MSSDSGKLNAAVERLEVQIRAAENLLKGTPGSTFEGVSAQLLRFYDGRIRFDGNTPLLELPLNERLEAAKLLPELIRKAITAESELVAKTNSATEAIEQAISEAQK